MPLMVLKRFFLYVLMAVVLSGCATAPPRLQESGFNSRFAFSPEIPFHEYIRQCENIIVKARPDINGLNRGKILEANRPFELKPDEKRFPRNRSGRYEKGILLVHGLSDSPYFLKPIARHMQERGFLVYAMLLPGHGTVPGDLLNVRYQEWVRATQYGLHQLRGQAEKLYLGGFSTGGALCMLEALNSRDIRGLILFAPAAGINVGGAWMADLMKAFWDWLGGPADDIDYAKYESFAVNGGAQVYHLTRELDAAFAAGKRLDMPVFCVVTGDDVSADTGKMIGVFSDYATSSKSLLLLYGKQSRTDSDQGDARIRFQSSFFPGERILDYSHVSLLIPPADPHYGRNGGYRYCLHYRNDREKRLACQHDPRIWQGEITQANLNRYTMRRLTYNPRFQGMTEALDRFLETLEP